MSVWTDFESLTIDDADTLSDEFALSFDKGITKLVIAIITEASGDNRTYPSFAFPSVGRPIAFPFSDEVLASELLLDVCWAAGLSPRAVNLLADGTKGSLRFVVDPLSTWATARISVDALKDSADLNIDPLNVLTGGTDSGEFVGEMQLEEILEKLDVFSIQAHPLSLQQWVSLRLPNPVCFTQFMDAIAFSLSAHWTWAGNAVYLGPPGCSGACSSSKSEACASMANGG